MTAIREMRGFFAALRMTLSTLRIRLLTLRMRLSTLRIRLLTLRMRLSTLRIRLLTLRMRLQECCRRVAACLRADKERRKPRTVRAGPKLPAVAGDSITARAVTSLSRDVEHELRAGAQVNVFACGM